MFFGNGPELGRGDVEYRIAVISIVGDF